jgi:AcrR family transcriptional regulator
MTLTFWKQGYQATSMRDLEAATGLTAGSLYKARKQTGYIPSLH